jgi:hypothetical protein
MRMRIQNAAWGAIARRRKPPKTFDYDAKPAHARAGTGAVRIAERRPSTTVAITAAA